MCAVSLPHAKPGSTGSMSPVRPPPGRKLGANRSVIAGERLAESGHARATASIAGVRAACSVERSPSCSSDTSASPSMSTNTTARGFILAAGEGSKVSLLDGMCDV